MKQNTLVVVADGHTATLFRNTEKHKVSLSAVEKMTPQNLDDDGSGTAPEERSRKEEDEATFAMQVAERLNAMVLKHKADEVIIIADPRTLGTMRKGYHKELEARIIKEIDKNLVGSPLADIEKAVS